MNKEYIISLLEKALRLEELSVEEGVRLWEEADTSELIWTANALRQLHKPGNVVTWMIDRNVNITNICISGCTFCNFHRKINEEGTYTTTLESYYEKIEKMIELGGDQLLLQGGMHPKYGLKFYTDLFSALKKRYPTIKLHSLGPPEVVHIARKERSSYREVLIKLMEAGLDSLPGAGAEILCDRVRKEISPGKATTDEWLGVMKDAHQLGMLTSATMMFGHIETLAERMEHFVRLRQIQSLKPEGTPGFKAFIPWPVMSEGTLLGKTHSLQPIRPIEYIRMIAMSRIMLPNIENIQASWLTVGKETGQMALHAGANDLGSIMIEENVVSAAGASFTMDATQMQQCIADAGFVPALRNQAYDLIPLPAGVPNYQLSC
ncbi:MAG: dehypoxanthine futalosine cyclase [Marinilabiliales bacterium]|nr:dehypoxanthine futalosine cyclase [Marinilabiliales bacterium]